MSNGRPWTADCTATLKRMAGSGASDAEIARYMNRDAKLIGKKRRDMGVERGIGEAMLRVLRSVNAKRSIARKNEHDQASPG